MKEYSESFEIGGKLIIRSPKVESANIFLDESPTELELKLIPGDEDKLFDLSFDLSEAKHSINSLFLPDPPRLFITFQDGCEQKVELVLNPDQAKRLKEILKEFIKAAKNLNRLNTMI